MMKLLTAEETYTSTLVLNAGVPLAAWASCSVDPNTKVPVKTAHAPVVQAEVNDGRWLVKCPWCASAQVVSPEDARFLCVPHPQGCGNAAVAGAFLSVVWPSPADQQEIEKHLSIRNRMNQHWQPGESADQLISENQAAGLM